MSRTIYSHPLHLGLGASVVPQPEFDGGAWYEAYGARHGQDGAEGRLVSAHRFSQSWDSWEMHPAGDEVVICLTGRMTLVQEFADGRIERVTIGEGEYAINPPGVWHTADIEGEASALFITAGLDTETRMR